MWRTGVGLGVVASVGATLAVSPAAADTMRWALTQAYVNNPVINAQRALVRSTDEAVPQALSGYRPKINVTAAVGPQRIDTQSKAISATTGGAVYPRTVLTTAAQTYGATYTQTLLNGGATASRTRLAEQQVSAARETLRNQEQTTLLAAATAYMNLIRDAATLSLQRSNVEVLQEQLRQTRDRYDVGEVTRTDVAQAESRLAAARATMLQAESNYTTSRSTYRQVIGVEPGKLDPASPVDRLSPSNLQQAVLLARSQHPAVTSQMFTVDAAVFAVKVAESSLYPSLSAVGSVQKTTSASTTVVEGFTASALAQLTIPVYQGGSEYSLIRQAKEQLQQQRVNLDNQRDVQQQNLVQTWGALEAAKAQVLANQQAVTAAEIALNGVREEARVGQRTTLDVLNAQQELVNARVNLVSAQRDRVVNSYTLLAAVGGLSPTVLQLDVPIYDPVVHYHQVRDTWAGVRTPDGK